MRAVSSGNDEAVPLARELSAGARLAMLALNFVPLLHAAAVLWALLLAKIAAAALILYVAPPLAARLLFAVCGKPRGKVPVTDGRFFVWWASFQLQALFCRFPALEEALRLLPGFYTGWLRLWGSRIGRLTYWAPGTLLLDRSYLRVGDDVTLGAGVRLNGHVIARDEAGRLELIVDEIVLGDRCSVGGYSLLTAGSEVASDEATRAFLMSPPYSKWAGGRREHA